jgi:hypothetical protein
MSVDLHDKETHRETIRHGSLTEDGESYMARDRRLIRKIDWHLLPWICLLYIFSLVDRYLSPNRNFTTEHNVLMAELTLALHGSLGWRRTYP